jgi:hypothetical protein
MATSLDINQLRAILNTDSDAQKTKPAKPWLRGTDAQDLITAVSHDADMVFLAGVNREFSIQYDNDKVWLSPNSSDFVPCGWFTIASLRNYI